MFAVLELRRESAARHWMALVFLVFEAAMIAIVLVYPLIFPPRLLYPIHSTPVPALTLAASELPERVARNASPQALLETDRPFVVSRRRFTFDRLSTGRESNEPASAPALTDVIPNTARLGTLGGIGLGALPYPAFARHGRRSVLMEGNLIRRVEPEYPALAKEIRLEGTVELRAVISPSGAVERLELREGHPLLARAAIEAVKQWRYRPYYLNGQAIEVETEITVKFTLNRQGE